ncbi:MAG TPA: hypothetical protein VL172_05625 [Kofleriaceae bacterium]|nr:hypothetical protein [Kofleriaceae bacterium]
MQFLEAVDIYFRGEKQLGWALVPVGVVLLGAGIGFWRWYGGGLGKGLGIPLAVVGLLAAIGGPMLVRTVAARQTRLATAAAQDPARPVADEVARMDKVNAAWPWLKAAWAALIVIALALLFTVHRDWVTGLSLALICVCAVLLIVDTTAQRRALIYADRLAALK